MEWAYGRDASCMISSARGPGRLDREKHHQVPKAAEPPVPMVMVWFSRDFAVGWSHLEHLPVQLRMNVDTLGNSMG